MNNTQLKVIDLSQEFLNFYYEAIDESLSIEESFELWHKAYNFSPIAPSKIKEEHIQELFYINFHRYSESLSVIESFVQRESLILDLIVNVKELLGIDAQFNITVIYYVGFFENKPFVIPYEDNLALCIPVEVERSLNEEKLILVHEICHILHAYSADIPLDWKRPLGILLFQEGLAMHVSKRLVPELKRYQYMNGSELWLDSCENAHSNIKDGFEPYLAYDNEELKYKFTEGLGSTNNQRELYYLSWCFMDVLINYDYTFKTLAHIAYEDILNLVEEAYIEI